MIRYLIDSSALWRVLRDIKYRDAWRDVISEGAIGSCHPQRAEFRRSARNLDEYEQMNDMFTDLYPDVGVPKNAWQWIESAQYRLLRGGAHRSMSTVDLLIAATASHHGLVVLHDDNDYRAASQYVTDLRQRSVRSLP
ncbi:ribonuclease VapC6 [Nocardiopsis rhodophaea]|uniref:Ribonuclease VapC n=1 Tax=Nocardiopsis rhodophaea TaxID=280238 RepID=A0ABN2S4C9_9ACTN